MKKINLLNKTISHLSSGYGFSPFHGKGVRRNRRGGMGITPSPLSPTKFLKFCGTRFGATPSWKEGERKVPSYRRTPVSSGFNRGGGIPLFSGMTAVIFSLFIATPSFAEPTELDKKTVASKAYVDTKQDIIETELVDYHDAEEDVDYTVPALVSYGTGTNNADGVLGNKIGILGSDQNWGGLGSWEFLDLFDDSEAAYLDNFVPTVRAVAEKLQNVWDYMPNPWQALSWSVNGDNGANRTNAINAYNTTFGTGTNNWAGNSGDLINGQFLANSLALKQNKIPAGTAGNVVTYSGTAGTVLSRGVYNNPSSVYFDNPNINDNELITVNAAAAIVDYVDARTPEITCAGVEPGTNECWLWTIPTYTTTTRPLPRGDGRTDVWVTGFTAKVSCINAIRQNTSITGLIEARDAVENAPTRVATGLSSTAASNLVSTLVSGSCTAEIRNP